MRTRFCVPVWIIQGRALNAGSPSLGSQVARPQLVYTTQCVRACGKPYGLRSPEPPSVNSTGYVIVTPAAACDAMRCLPSAWGDESLVARHVEMQAGRRWSRGTRKRRPASGSHRLGIDVRTAGCREPVGEPLRVVRCHLDLRVRTLPAQLAAIQPTGWRLNRLSQGPRTEILRLLVEGVSLRSITRITGCSINTATKLLVDAGKACAACHDEHVRGLRLTRRIQVDEIWSFVYAKEKNVRSAKKSPQGAGDAWTWTGHWTPTTSCWCRG